MPDGQHTSYEKSRVESPMGCSHPDTYRNKGLGSVCSSFLTYSFVFSPSSLITQKISRFSMSNADEGGVCGLWKNRLIIRSLLLEEDRQLIDLHWLEYKGSIPRAVIYRLSYII